MRRSFLSALVQKKNVMGAVILRDMRTRFFDHGLGFLVVILWPLAHLLVLISIYSLIGRASPYGDSLILFFATGLVPTLSFMYVSRMMVLSIVQNRPMLSFPAIHISDILFGRAVLEILGSFLMSATVLLIFWMWGEEIEPYRIADAVGALCATLFFAIGMGLLFGLIAALNPAVALGYTLLVVLVYLLSGTLFVPANLPEQIKDVLAWNPVLHGVEWMRTAYFLDYPTSVLSRSYLVISAAFVTLLALVCERYLRPYFMMG
jgi:capsular polysaccharide transport system permease protein